MPQLGLHVLPLHLARYELHGEQRCVLDEYEVTYAPSATVLALCQKRAAEEFRRTAQGLLAIGNPTDDLVFAPAELDAIEADFAAADQPRRRLNVEAASQEAVVREAPGHAYIHFASHGIYYWNDPLASALLLFGQRLGDGRVQPDPFTLAEIQRNLDLLATRLVTLSACETGISDPSDVMDDYVGLPSGFLLAGTPVVVSSLWAVDDFSTALLMAGFYHRHLHEGQSIGAALRGAQLWLRGLKRDHVVAWATDVRDNLHARTPVDDATGRLLWSRLDALKEALLEDYLPDECPFSHPFYWAAFTATGGA